VKACINDNTYKISQRNWFVKRFKSLAGGDLYHLIYDRRGAHHPPQFCVAVKPVRLA
jgi:hypothetical protein